jgi:hypothetical protein
MCRGYSDARPQARILVLLLVLHIAIGPIFAPAQAQAQTATNGGVESSMLVNVLDPNGAALVSARVRLSDGHGQERALDTNSRGEALFNRLKTGKYRLQVEAAGFEPLSMKEVAVEAGVNHLQVNLEVSSIKEEVKVSQERREEATDPHGTAFTTVLTEEQLAQLPDDPEEFSQVLREMAGPGAIIRVNGFSGGKLPPKSQIREIRFRLNPYAAENHVASNVAVDIYTKPGLDNWHGTFNFGFRDESLNARQAFAPRRGPEQYRRMGLTLDGPIWRNRTSLFLNLDGHRSFDSQTIVAALPEGNFNSLVPVPSNTLNLSARIEHTLTKYHTLRAEYQRNALRQDNLGVGNFDLPERAYGRNQTEHLFRLSDTGPLSQRTVNEFLLQARWLQVDQRSLDDSPAILVLNAFNRGGAQINSTRHTRELEIADNFDLAFRNHSLRAGVLFESDSYSSDEQRNYAGTFTFANLDAFRRSRPTTFTQRTGDPSVNFNQYQFGWYLQDDIRLRKNLSLNLGVRQEIQTQLDDRNNIAPRAGLAWSPFADGKTTIRAGTGIFYQWFDANIYEQALRVNGQRERDIVVQNPGFPNPFDGGRQLTLAPSRIQQDPRLSMPYIWQASLGVERQVSKTLLLRTNYFYQRGIHQLRGRNINAPLEGLGRPDPSSGNVTEIESSANSWLHMLNLNLSPSHYQFGKRLFWVVNYSLARSISEADGPLSLPADNFNLRGERGPSQDTPRHHFFAIVNYKLLKTLQLGTTFRAGSALPYNITTGFDDNGDTVSNDRPAGLGRNSARGAANWEMSARLSWTINFGPRVDETPRAGASVIRTGNDSDTLGALSSGRSKSRWHMQTYLQVFNLFNHTNLTNFSGVETSPFFGHATSALPGRRIETGVRFSF